MIDSTVLKTRQRASEKGDLRVIEVCHKIKTEIKANIMRIQYSYAFSYILKGNR